MWGVNRRRKGAANTLAALKSIRAARADGAPIYVVPDNLSAHKGADIRRWAKKNNVELCFTPTYSWANPIEARFGPLRRFTIATSNQPNHPTQTRAPPLLAPAQRQRPTATSWPPNAENAPASAARRASAGRTPTRRRSLPEPASQRGHSASWFAPNGDRSGE